MEPYAPVISLLITCEQEPGKILVGIRDEDSNTTHPNVLSTPTSRIPYSLESAIKKDVLFVDIEHKYTHFPEQVLQTSIAVNAPTFHYSGREQEQESPLIYCVNSLLAKKLITPFLNTQFYAKVSSRVYGDALYDSTAKIGRTTVIRGTEVRAERIAMYGIQVHMQENNFPAQTGPYSALRWITIEEFDSVLATRSVIPVAKQFGSRSIGYCAHGLCLLSAAVAAKHKPL